MHWDWVPTCRAVTALWRQLVGYVLVVVGSRVLDVWRRIGGYVGAVGVAAHEEPVLRDVRVGTCRYCVVLGRCGLACL